MFLKFFLLLLISLSGLSPVTAQMLKDDIPDPVLRIILKTKPAFRIRIETWQQPLGASNSPSPGYTMTGPGGKISRHY